MAQKVFVIYGQDEDAHNTLNLFIRSLELKELTFDEIANSLGTNPFIADIVVAGVQQADAVIALFTPDEQAALFSSDGKYADNDSQGARWQARPNVIFEAGLAYSQPEKTILVTLGTDVSLFSDVSGIHFINFDKDETQNKKSKYRLRERLARIVKIPNLPAHWEEPSYSGDFSACMRKRWQYYDEFNSLESALDEISIDETGIHLLWILQLAAKEYLRNAKAFMSAVVKYFGEDIAEKAYWELIVSGFMKFKDVNTLLANKKNWKNSVAGVSISERGKWLLLKLADVDDPMLRIDQKIVSQHREIDRLIKNGDYKEAQTKLNEVLKNYSASPRAHFNQARIFSQRTCTSSTNEGDLLLDARMSLANSLEHGFIRLLVLTGNFKIRTRPLGIIKEHPDLAPLFKEWPEIGDYLTNPDQFRRLSSGSPGCIGGNMAIELPGNRVKAAKDVAMGESIIAWDIQRSSKAEARITRVEHHVSEDALVINENYCFTSVHPLLTPAGWICAEHIKLGMELCLHSGAVEPVISIRKLNHTCEVVDITATPYSTFIANGLIVHNKMD